MIIHCHSRSGILKHILFLTVTFGVAVLIFCVPAGAADCTSCHAAERKTRSVYLVDHSTGQPAWYSTDKTGLVTRPGDLTQMASALWKPWTDRHERVRGDGERYVPAVPKVRQWFGDKPGEVVALVKPQFEAGREEVKKHKGVIRDRAVHAQVLRQVIAHARQIGFTPAGLIPSPITGSDGNTEFLLWLRVGCDGKGFDDDEAVARVIPPEAD